MDNTNIIEGNYKAEPVNNPPSLSVARKHFVLNILANAFYQGIYTVLTLWMTPFLMKYLGVAVFGMIPLVNTLASYMNVFTDALNVSVSRFLAIDLGEGNTNAANKTFNTALFSILGVIGLLIPAAVVTSLAFSALFQVPIGWEVDASWLFAIIAASFFISVISGIFSISSFVHSQFLLSNIVNMVSLLARIGVVFVLFTAFRAHLWYAGGGVIIGALVSLLGYTILWRRLTPQLRIKVSVFDRSRLRSLTGMGGWTLVNSVGSMLLNRVDLLVVNAYFGPVLTGGYGAMVQLAVLIEILVATVSTVFRPVFFLKFAQRDFVGLRAVAMRSVKMFGLVLALPVGLMCGFSQPLISIWLGPSFTYLSLLLIILVSHQSLNLSTRPLAYVNTAYNKVQWPGIITLICGMASVAADILVARFGLWGYLGIAGSTALIWTVRNAIYVPIYTSRHMGQPWYTFFPSLIWSIIGTALVGSTAYLLTKVYMPNNWLVLAVFASFISFLYAGFVWAVAMDSIDRKLVLELIPLKRK